MLTFTSVTEFFRDNYQVQNEDLLAELERVTVVRPVKEGEILMSPGEVPREVLFLAQGITRCFFLDDKGHEHTESFGGQYGLPLMPSGGLGEPCSNTLEVIRPGIILSISTETIEKMAVCYPEIQTIVYRLLSESARANAEIRKVLYLYNARQRYEWFVTTFPEISTHVSQKHAASFLKMTPETYCRIKKEYENKDGLAAGSGKSPAAVTAMESQE